MTSTASTADHQHRSCPAGRRCRWRQADGHRPARQPARRRRPHHDTDGLIAAAMAREEQSATGLPGGIAIPHCRSPYVETASIGFARLNPAVDFGAPDGPADLAFLIAAPESGGAEHMKLLSSLAACPGPQGLRRVATQREDVRPRSSSWSTAWSTVGRKAASPQPNPSRSNAKTLVAVTACPTGIAHTYMAADSLVAAAKKAGATLHVETQGSSGSTPLSPDDHRQRRRGHLRHRRRRQGQAAVRRQARRRIRRQTRHQRAGQDGRRSARRRGQSRRSPRAGRRGRARRRGGPGGRRRLGHPDPPDPAHRRQLHDPVRRRWRPADRAGLPVRAATTSPTSPRARRSRWAISSRSPTR